MLARKVETLQFAPTKGFVRPLSSVSHKQILIRRKSWATRAAASDASRSTSTSMTTETSTASTSSPSPSPSPLNENLPTTYRRLVARVPSPTFRDAARVEEVSLPPGTPKEGEVLVKIAVAGVNGGCETFRVRAEAGTPFAEPTAANSVPLGAEGAGTVVAVGPGVRSSVAAVGDRVTVNGGSAFSEFVVAGARSCFKVPSSSDYPPLSAASAVALSLSGLTAAVALKATAKLQRGETVLVTAAAGGAGHLAVQLAALSGCRVVAVAGGEKKVSRLRRELIRLDPENEQNHVVIDHKSGKAAEDLAGALSEALKGNDENENAKGFRGIDVAFEGVGGDVRRAVLRNLSPGARVLSVGYIGSYPHTKRYSDGGKGEDLDIVEVSAPEGAEPAGKASIPPEPVLFWQRRIISLPGDRTLFGDVWSGAAGDPRTPARLRKELFASALKGEIVPWIDDDEDPSNLGRRFVGLESASDAVERLLGGESMGKVVLRVSEEG